MAFILRIVIAALALWLATEIVPGIEAEGWGTLILAALLLGVVNAIVRPVVVFLTLPLTLLTLGLFLLVINAAMLGLVGCLLKDFTVDGFVPALLGAIVVGVVSWAGGWVVGRREE